MALKGLNEREEAARLAGAVLYRRDEDSEEPVEAYEPSTKLEGLRSSTSMGKRWASSGTCWTRTRARRSPLAVGARAERRGTASCPGPDLRRGLRRSASSSQYALLDLAFDYAPPPPVIRGLLASGE